MAVTVAVTVSLTGSVTVTVKIWLGAIGVMMSGPSDEEAVGAGAGGASLDAAGASVGDGSTFVTEYDGPEEVTDEDEAMGVLNDGFGVGSALGKGMDVSCTLVDAIGGVE